MIENLNITATTLGYLTLLVWVLCIIGLTLTVSRRIVFDWRKKRFQEKEWDNIRSSWLIDGNDESDTDVFENVYDYQKEIYRDAS